MSNLPDRLKSRKDQPDGFYRKRRGAYFLKSAEFKKIYNKVINPYLREQGFKVSGFNAFKRDEQFMYSVSWSSNKFGGEGCMDMYLHPNGFPTIQEHLWREDRAKNGSHALFTKRIGREHPNDWVDFGTNEEEAFETCEYLLHHLKETYTPFVDQFLNFPKNFLEIDANNFHERYSEIYDTYGLSVHGDTKYYAALWSAKLHSFYQSDAYSAIAEIAREEILKSCEKEGTDPAFFNERIDEIKAGILFRFS